MPCNLRLVRKNGFVNLRRDAHHRIQRSHRLLKSHRNLAPPHMPPLLLAQSNKIPPRSCILRRSLRTFVGEELAPPSSLPLNKTSPLTRAPADANHHRHAIHRPHPSRRRRQFHRHTAHLKQFTHVSIIVATILSIARKKE